MKYPIKFELEFRKHKFPGTFIVFEGIDASGKTTHAKDLVEKLKARGVKAIYTKEPTDGEIGQLIRRVLGYKTKVPPVSLQYLFCADRGIHQKEIIGWLKKGYVVVSDRYFWSAVAYGISDLSGVVDYYLTVYSVLSFYNQFIAPDFNFFVDVEADEAVARIKKSGEHKEIYENREKIVKIKDSYKKIIAKFQGEFAIIDANRPIGKVSEELFTKVKNIL